MKAILTILGGLGAGAAMMYLLDPERGNQRRALIRDKVGKLNRQTQETVSGRMKDLSNRAKGMLHNSKSAFESDEGTSQQQPTTFS